MSMTLSLCCETLLGDKFWRSFEENVVVNSYASFLEQQKFYERKSSFPTGFFDTSILPQFHRFGYTNMASLTIRTPIPSHRAIWHNTNQLFLSTPWKCTQLKSMLTFVSLSAEVSLIVTEWFMKATVLSDVSIFPSSVWCKCLLGKCLTITNGVIIKGYVHICGSHLSFGLRLTHVL